jgi:hypothetical protein
MVPRDIRVYGYIYNVANGKLMEVAKAMEIGMAEDRRGIVRAA